MHIKFNDWHDLSVYVHVLMNKEMNYDILAWLSV